MGVQGLWELLSPAGRPVTLESLENKILAVDVSIWLNQAIKGIRDRKGEPVPHAHLLSIFHKICKLLFYKIKPVFVFDGSVPLLKKQTLLVRQTQRQAAASNAKKASHSILKNYIIRSLKNHPNAGIGKSDELYNQIQNPAISDIYSASNDMYCTPPLRGSAISGDEIDSHIESETDEEENYIYNDYIVKNFQNPSSIDFETEAFKSLPLDVQHELLNTIKETHKRRYWVQEEMPEEYQTFSHYQMNRLLHRRKIQKRLEEVEKDINSKNTASLDTIYNSYMSMESGTVEASRVMSEDSSHFIFVKHQSKKCDNAEQTEAFSLCSEKITGKEMKQNLIASPLPSSIAKNTEAQENLSEHSISCVLLPDQNHTVTKINLEDSIEAADDFLKWESLTNIAGHTSSNSLALNNFSSQTETSNIALPSTVSSNISTENAENSELYTKRIHKESNDEDSSCKNSLPAHTAKDVTAEFDECENTENEFTERKDTDTGAKDALQPKTTYFNDHGEIHAAECNIKNKSGENPASITINLTLQQSDDDEFLPVEEIERTEENMNEEKDKETNYCLSEAQDSISLIEELETLNREKQNQERRALTIAEHMYEETKELLKLFGVPYINSPTEAEAQCAMLDMLNLTNGTITDDSDIWLFGGQYVYKNFFSKNKYVEFFKHTDIESHFNLDRLKLIALAMLTGSDYTQGVQGIGPITAMEILSEFPGDGIKRLQNYKKWWSDFQKNKELPKNAVCEKLSKFHLDDGFPSEVVYDAYLHPSVDESTERFSWGHPDLYQLREFAQEKFGWDQKKVDDMLLPVMKKLNENQLQMRIDSFFHTKLKKQENPLSSKRLKNAITKMHSFGSSAVINSKDTNKVQKKQRRKSNQKQNKRKMVACSSQGTSKFNLSEESSSDS